MTGWEYKVLQFPGITIDPSIEEELLNLQGSKGWKLVSVVSTADGHRVGYLKRATLQAATEGDVTLSMKAQKG